MTSRYWLETLGCPKNQVDSDKLAGTLAADGFEPAPAPEQADIVVVNTCAFIEEARRESLQVIDDLAERRRAGARLVVSGCYAERLPEDLASRPGVDAVRGFGQPVSFGRRRQALAASSETVPEMDLLNLPRPRANAPWAYVKVAEGCDRRCGFCAIPSFRGPQRSRDMGAILAEIEALKVSEVVLVAQDLGSYGRDGGRGRRRLGELVEAAGRMVPWVRLMYLYPSDLTNELIEAILSAGVAYFDLSLQHVSRPLLRKMRRWGDRGRFAERIGFIRSEAPHAAFRTNFIVGYPGETEDDHDALLEFVSEMRLDWVGLFRYSEEPGTYSAGLDGRIPPGLVTERLNEIRSVCDEITESLRDRLVGERTTVLVEREGEARSHREAPEVDGVIRVPSDLPVGEFCDVEIVSSDGVDLRACRIGPRGSRHSGRRTGGMRLNGPGVANIGRLGIARTTNSA